MKLNDIEVCDTFPRKYEINTHVKMADENEQFFGKDKLKPIYRIKFKRNFNWFHILFLILVLLTVIASIITMIMHSLTEEMDPSLNLGFKLESKKK